MIYLDNAATSLYKPKTVAQAVAKAISNLGNPARGIHDASLTASYVVYETRKKLAHLFGCPRVDHVIFTSNATEALNIAIYGILSLDDHVISTDLEHNSVLRPLYDLHERGMELDFVPTHKGGIVDCMDFEQLIHKNTKAIVCTHASNLTGNMLDIKRIAKIAHSYNVLLILDASQTAGIFPINMEELGVDVLCFTGHKGLMGPQGTGGLCIRENIEILPFKRGGSGVYSYDIHQPMSYPTRLEAGTLNSHGIAGLSAAIDYIFAEGVQCLYKKDHDLMQLFYNGIKNVEGVTIYGDFLQFPQAPKAPIVALNIWNFNSSDVSDILFTKYGIATRPGAHCAPRMHEALNTTNQGAVRFSFSPFNTKEEILIAIEAIKDIAKMKKSLQNILADKL